MRSSFHPRRRVRPGRAGFTFLEVFATMIVLMLALTALAQFMASVDQSWQQAASDPFAEADLAFRNLTRNLTVATLEPYRDYADANGSFRTSPTATFTPDHLARRSDLDFVCGPGATLLATTGRTTSSSGVFFAAPVGQTRVYAQTAMNHLFNALGYFIEFGPDANAPSFFTGPARLRWRLKQIEQPSESLQIFSTTTSSAWIAQLTGPSAAPGVLAENVIALVVLPEQSAGDTTLAPAYVYDSRNAGNPLTFAQLPPRVRVLMAAIDEPSAQHLAALNGATAPILLPPGSFQDATRMSADVSALDGALTAAKIGHRLYQRDLALAASAWSTTP